MTENINPYPILQLLTFLNELLFCSFFIRIKKPHNTPEFSISWNFYITLSDTLLHEAFYRIQSLNTPQVAKALKKLFDHPHPKFFSPCLIIPLHSANRRCFLKALVKPFCKSAGSCKSGRSKL